MICSQIRKIIQLIFCDSSTPKKDGTFNVYDALKEKLMQKGVPEQEIAFIHDANTDVQKAKLFTKVRSGQVRFLLGSTSKIVMLRKVRLTVIRGSSSRINRSSLDRS